MLKIIYTFKIFYFLYNGVIFSTLPFNPLIIVSITCFSILPVIVVNPLILFSNRRAIHKLYYLT